MEVSMPNTANIDQLIQWVTADIAHFRMEFWKKKLSGTTDDDFLRSYEPCDTAMCLGGTIYFKDQLDKGVEPKNINFADVSESRIINGGAEFLGIAQHHARVLFFMSGVYNNHAKFWTARENFDTKSDAFRLLATTKVLEALKTTGIVDWDAAIRQTSDELGEAW
jgi:hypothetical protein